MENKITALRLLEGLRDGVLGQIEQPTEMTYASRLSAWMETIFLEEKLPFTQTEVELAKSGRRADILAYNAHDDSHERPCNSRFAYHKIRSETPDAMRSQLDSRVVAGQLVRTHTFKRRTTTVQIMMLAPQEPHTQSDAT